MRLIDADNIKLNDELPYKASVKRVLAKAPTVDAIPIEWMEKYADLNRFTTPDGQVIIRFRWIVDEMVADWREALEVQSNESNGGI